MANFLPGDEEICFTCHLMQECSDAGKLPSCLGVIEPIQQTITNVKSFAEATAEQIAARILELASDPCKDGFVPISTKTLN